MVSVTAQIIRDAAHQYALQAAVYRGIVMSEDRVSKRPRACQPKWRCTFSAKDRANKEPCADWADRAVQAILWSL